MHSHKNSAPNSKGISLTVLTRTYFKPSGTIWTGTPVERQHLNHHIHTIGVYEIPGRHAVRSHNQIALDMSRKDVQDYLIEKVNAILDNANIFYVKWDINRSLVDIWFNELPSDKLGEVYHHYILGLYRIMNNIIKTHLDILFEVSSAAADVMIQLCCTTIRSTGQAYSGSALMNVGLPINREVPEYTSFQFYIKKMGI